MSAKLVSRIFIFLLLFSAFSAFAYADDCVALGGSIVGAECQISTNVKKVGSYTIDETLRILADKTINATNTSVIGIDLTIDGDLIMEPGSRIFANDPLGFPDSNSPASPITLDITGNLEMYGPAGIVAENRVSGGSSGKITIDLGGNVHLRNLSTISSARTTGGGTGNGGDIDINAGGNIDFDEGSIVSASNVGSGKAGDITIEADGKINIDGLISVGPSINVVSTKYTGDIVSGGNTQQRGGKITIISNSQNEPGITIGDNAIIVSQGQDPGSDKILLEACGIDVNGLIGSVASKSHASDSVPGIVTLRSGTTININGQDLGSVGPAQARVRADDITGEEPKPRRVDIFADGKITVNGALSGSIYTVTSNAGGATNQFGGSIRLISLNDGVLSSALAFQARGSSAGGDGGKLNLSGKTGIDIDSTSADFHGDFTPTIANGGKIDAKSYSNDISWFTGMGDVRPTGDGVANSNRGTVNLTACTIVDTLGTLFPTSSGSATVPGILTGLCSPSAPSLPPGEGPLPICEPTNEIPEFTTIGAALVLLGAGFYIYRKRKK